MRDEKEVINQLLDFARRNEMVRAVLMNGSRVNAKAPKDIFCDYDIVFAVTDPKYFLADQNWIKNFGELIIMQQNTCNEKGVEWYIFLMLFTDGVRIDLSFHPVEAIDIQLEDSLKVALLDKDGILQELDPPSDASYFIKKPTCEEFDDAANEILWCSTNVAKGLWRDELPYAKYMLDVIVRESLIKMVSWHIGMNHEWRIDTGKAGKWFKRYLREDLWGSFEKTYSGAGYEDIWRSLFETLKLTRKIGIEIAGQLGYEYPLKDDESVTEYLIKVKNT